MKYLRLLLAVAACATAAALTPERALAGSCPSIITGPAPYYACGYRSGSCPNCKYECSNGQTITVSQFCNVE